MIDRLTRILLLTVTSLVLGAAHASHARADGGAAAHAPLDAQFWRLETHDKSVGTVEVKPETDATTTLAINITQLGAEAWHAQVLYEGGLAVEKGQTYKLKFNAKGDGIAGSYVFVAEDGGDYARLGDGAYIGFSSTLAPHEYTFTADRDAKIRIVLGNLNQLGTLLISSATFTRSSAKAAADPALDQHVARLDIDPAPLQTIRGWGGFAGYHNETIWAPTWSFVDRPEAMRVLADLNINVVRASIEPEYYDPATGKLTTHIESLVRHLRAIRSIKPDCRYILAVWSPPASMKDPPFEDGVVTGKPGVPDGTKTRLREDKEQAFVEFLVSCMQHLKSKGVGLPVNLSLQNEPGHAVGYDSTFYDRGNPVQYFRVARMLRAALDKADLSEVKLLGPDINDFASALWILGDGFSKLTGDPEALKSISTLGVHTYDTWLKDAGHRKVKTKEFAAAVKDYKTRTGSEVWMTEFSIDIPTDGWSEMDKSILMARHFARDLTAVPFDYWIGWHVPGVTIDYSKPLGDPSAVVLGPDYHLFKALWDAAPAGAVVHRVKSDDPQLVGDGLTENDAIAFTYNGKTTVLVINANSHVKSVTLGGLSPTKVVARVTTKESNLAPLEMEASDNRIELKLPPRSIVILTQS